MSYIYLLLVTHDVCLARFEGRDDVTIIQAEYHIERDTMRIVLQLNLFCMDNDCSFGCFSSSSSIFFFGLTPTKT